MSLSKYYKIFGLPENASQSDIKRRYRQLVMEYHPDKHQGNAQKFIEIKEAYEYLTGKKKTLAQETYTYSATRSTSQARQQSTEDRIKQAQQRRKENEYKEYVENERFFQQLTSGLKWKFIQFSAKVGAVLALLLILEFFLPYKYERDQIVAYGKSSIGGFDHDVPSAIRMYSTKGRKSFVEETNYFRAREAEVFIVKTALFHNEKGILPLFYSRNNSIWINSQSDYYKIQFTLGAHSTYLIPFFIAPFLVVYFKRRTYTFTLFYYLSLYLFAPLMYVFLFTSERWLHLLTLGFF